MTEEEWVASSELWTMWEEVCSRASSRKRRLFGCACCRRIWHLLDRASQDIVTIAERFADGNVSQCKLQDAERQAGALARGRCREDYVGLHATSAAMWVASEDAADAGWNAATEATKAVRAVSVHNIDPVGRERESQVILLREIFGNPFRPVTFSAEWRTSDVLLLAQGIDVERAFDRMPILADALQDAGCDHTDILGHLRDANATHVRGCWALDLVLGKE